MRNTVLVLTNTMDGIHSSIVIAKLKKLGLQVFRMDADRLASGDIKIRMVANPESFEFEIEGETRKLASKNIKSIWYRRPNRLNSPIRDPVQRKYAELEMTLFLEGLWASTNKAIFWLSDPVNLERARKKILQLKVACDLGFSVPKTIVTNDSEHVRAFFKICTNGMIFKAVHHEMLDYEEKSFNIPTTLVTEEHLERLDLVRYLPSLFQEFVDKKCELRVTVVGENIFPVQIDSQAYQETAVDWRKPEFIPKLRYTPVQLPQDVEKKCFAMIKVLGLEFGAFDFAVDKNDICYFLEVNPNGQWYWLEDQTGLLISDAIADTLARGTERR